MASKILNTRLVQKNDTSENWAKATNFTPLKGEIIVYTDLGKIKIGDGVTKVGSLEFLKAELADKLSINAGSATQPIYFKDGVPTAINALDSVAFDGYVTKGKMTGTTVGANSTAEGLNTQATKNACHAEGSETQATGDYAHAEGTATVASGAGSHAEGYGTYANGDYQHAQGKYNEKDIINKYASIVGNGTSDSKRSNAHTLDWDGNAWFAGKISVGTLLDVPNPLYANDLVTKKYVDNKFATKSVSLAADSWTGTESPYSQVVTLDGVTTNSKVDLNPTGEQLNSLATNRTILNTANDNGTVTVYAVGNKPIEDYTMQVTITEV